MTALEPTLRRFAMVFGLLLAGDALLLALFHLDDLFAAHQGPGIWMALARYENQGTLYPPLQQDGFYGGSRYTPLFFSLTAGLAWITPDYLIAAKLAALLSGLVLVSGVAAGIRQMTGRWQEVPLAALLLAFPQGLASWLMPHADALAAGLAVWGLVVLGRTPTWPRIAGSALLFVLAVLTKFSTLAAPTAAFLFLLFRKGELGASATGVGEPPQSGGGGTPTSGWKLASGLLLACALLGLGSLGLIEWLSQGRFFENLRALGGGGSGLASALEAPARMGEELRRTLGFAVLLPLLAVALLLRARRFGGDLWDSYLLTAVVFTLLVYTSRGTADNHLLELEAAGVLFLARVVSTPTAAPGLERLLQTALLAVALIVMIPGLLPHLGTWRAGEAESCITKQQVDQAIPSNARLLAETPTIPALRGQRPVVLDSFAFGVLARTGKIDDAALAERIRRHEFDVLIMLGRTDKPKETFCPDIHLGPRVTSAILESYQFDRPLGMYALFVPRKKGAGD